MMYNVVAQLVLLHVSDSWVLTGVMLKFLEGFHHRVVRRITGITVTHGAGGNWEYHPVVVALEAAVLQPTM